MATEHRETKAANSADTVERPELAVVVISVKAPGCLADAVRSLLDQDVPVEIVVVNTGGGSAAQRLSPVPAAVTIIERQDRLYPGAARNLGIAAAKAEHIAFLASDCRATAGWARQRLASHQRGYASVGSALLPDPDDSAIAWASHLSLFVRRLPHASRLWALPEGASFHRSVFESHGVFSETLRIGEDTEFSRRLPEPLRPVWVPAVVATHDSPTRLAEMLVDQYRRGRRASALQPRGRWARISNAAKQLWGRSSVPLRLVRRTKHIEGEAVRRALPLVPLCAVAYSIGLIVGGVPTEA